MTTASVHRPVRLGLTGGIGSGKSTVASAMQSLGAQVIDADAISRGTTQAGGSAIEQIAAIFGSRFIAADGSLDRQMMREHIFAQPGARIQLETIVHPLVANGIASQVAAATSSCIVFDVPLLVESPRWRQQLDRVWVVDCPEAIQIARVEKRSGWERSMVQAVIANQAGRSQRVAAADVVIYNDAISLKELQGLVEELASEFGL